ncbi:MAG TPA: hypothetical protein VFP98_01515, partial [Candidatus Polarisedimenticolia bacterium]|nr:hypothetical protein [Candidatus Polarisedimenticolia bacterium]
DVGRNWQRSGEELRALSEGRQRQVREAIPVVKDEIRALKASLKVARAQKRTVESGTLGGELAAAEAALDVLDSLEDHSAEQMKLAEAWVEAGVALRDFDQADRAFDAHRQRRIIQAERVGRGVDERLDAAGYEVFQQRARALETLGKRLSDLGSEAKSVGKSDMKFMDELERDGRIQPRR